MCATISSTLSWSSRSACSTVEDDIKETLSQRNIPAKEFFLLREFTFYKQTGFPRVMSRVVPAGCVDSGVSEGDVARPLVQKKKNLSLDLPSSPFS